MQYNSEYRRGGPTIEPRRFETIFFKLRNSLFKRVILSKYYRMYVMDSQSNMNNHVNSTSLSSRTRLVKSRFFPLSVVSILVGRLVPRPRELITWYEIDAAWNKWQSATYYKWVPLMVHNYSDFAATIVNVMATKSRVYIVYERVVKVTVEKSPKKPN